jgi:hypothetical protein
MDARRETQSIASLHLKQHYPHIKTFSSTAQLHPARAGDICTFKNSLNLHLPLKYLNRWPFQKYIGKLIAVIIKTNIQIAA